MPRQAAKYVHWGRAGCHRSMDHGCGAAQHSQSCHDRLVRGTETKEHGLGLLLVNKLGEDAHVGLAPVLAQVAALVLHQLEHIEMKHAVLNLQHAFEDGRRLVQHQLRQAKMLAFDHLPRGPRKKKEKRKEKCSLKVIYK
jgi:hypothetical protein